VNTTAANSATTLRFDTSAPINGPGNIQLNGINPGDAVLSASGVTVTNGANHTIHGRGDISFTSNGTVFVNNGTITGDGANSEPIRLSLSTASGNQNNGIIKGTLVLEQGFLDQRGGGALFGVTLGANGNMPTIVGGFFNAGFHGACQANSVSVDGCTNLAGAAFDGGIVVPSGGVLAVLSHGLTNKTRIEVGGELRFDSSASIDGGGKIFMNGGVLSASGVTATFDQHIDGGGDISMAANNTVFVNKGTIISDGDGPLRFFLSNSPANENDGDIDSSSTYRGHSPGSGQIVFEQGSIDQSGGGRLRSFQLLQLGGAQTFTVTGGTIITGRPEAPLPVPVVHGVAAVLGGDITLAAKYEIPANDFTLITATKLTNNGTMTLDASTSLLRFDASTEIDGTGSTVLNNSLLEVSGGIVNNVTNVGTHTITGNGTIQIDSGSIEK
jgi:hypothetical protein